MGVACFNNHTHLINRTVLLWEHSDLAILAVVNVLLSFGNHSKVR